MFKIWKGNCDNAYSQAFKRAFFPLFPGFVISRRTLGMKGEYSLLGHQQIGQSEQRKELRRVLGKPAIAHLLQPENVLDDMERVKTG